jgi:hypothetical protein
MLQQLLVAFSRAEDWRLREYIKLLRKPVLIGSNYFCGTIFWKLRMFCIQYVCK